MFGFFIQTRMDICGRYVDPRRIIGYIIFFVEREQIRKVEFIQALGFILIYNRV